MREFTKEEIYLCKQVAEKHRKEIKKGDWAIEPDRANIPLLVIDTQMEYITLSLNYEATHDTTCKSLIPLWTISDCLEFLKSRSFYGSISDVGSYYEAYYKKMIIGKDNEDLSIKVGSGIVKTPLEACLKAILAVLEEEKDESPTTFPDG